MEILRRLRNPIVAYAVLTVTFFLLIVVLPADKTTVDIYKVTPGEYHALLFAIELPQVVVWLAAFVGTAQLKKYARSVKKTSEGPGFERLARGTEWLAWGLAVPAIIGLILNALANKHPGFHPAATIITNYLHLLVPITAFSIIGVGSRHLNEHSKARTTVDNAKAVMFIFVALGVLFCYLVFRHLDLHNINSTNNPYYLPGWLMILSVTIPYLYAWFVGLLSAYDINVIAKNIKGVLYRQALLLLSSGLLMVIVSSIGVQYLYSVIPRTGHLAINGRLVAVYSFYIIETAGFVLLSFGANKLKKIEEV